MVRLLEYAGPPEIANVPASSGALVGFLSLSSAKSRVESGSSVTPPSVKIKSSGERVAIGKDSTSWAVTVRPTTVRVVSTA